MAVAVVTRPSRFICGRPLPPTEGCNRPTGLHGDERAEHDGAKLMERRRRGERVGDEHGANAQDKAESCTGGAP